jgi:hypothetical protein
MDAKTELAIIRQRRKLKRKRRYIKSALEAHRAELVALRLAGGTLADLQLWVKIHYRLNAAVSTISRYLSSLPELTNAEL